MAEHARQHLDKAFSKLRTMAVFLSLPAGGWIRTIREALGMTTTQMAKRMQVSQPRIVMLEKGELNKSITLRSLENAAEKLGCTLIYALLPSEALEDSVRKKLLEKLEQALTETEHTMRLENQHVGMKKTGTLQDSKKGLDAYREAIGQEAAQELFKKLMPRLWDSE